MSFSALDYGHRDRSTDMGITSNRDILSGNNDADDSNLSGFLANYEVFAGYDRDPLPLYDGDKLPAYTPPSSVPPLLANLPYRSRFIEHFDISMPTLEAPGCLESLPYATSEGCELKNRGRHNLFSKLRLRLTAKIEKCKRKLLCCKNT
ncbi:hypothetical protein F4678DRAFT_464436 [Xylaria arbuscula]|nr:hypothetical protein F4678DRAFT_464436 [Xylaria arbuscula]